MLLVLSCLFIGNNVIAQQTTSKVISIATHNITKHSKVATGKNMPQLRQEPKATSANAKKKIKPMSTEAQRKALNARLDRLETSNMTPAQKTIMKKRIQDRLNSLK